MTVEVLGLQIDAKLRKKAAGLSYGITAVVSLILGSVYLFKQSFMPYHADAIGKSWNAVEAANQVLVSALMTVAGGGWFTVGGVLVLLLAFSFRNDRRWVLYAIPAVILLFYLPNLWATLTVLQTTPANPPWQGNVFACLSAIIGFGLYHKPLEERSLQNLTEGYLLLFPCSRLVVTTTSDQFELSIQQGR